MDYPVKVDGLNSKVPSNAVLPERAKTSLKDKDGIEDIKISNFYFKKLKTIELCNLCLTIMIIGNSIVIYEIDYAND